LYEKKRADIMGVSITKQIIESEIASMDALLKKLNFKEEEKILVLNSPPEYKGLLEDFSKSTKVLTNIKELENDQGIKFALIFLFKQEDITKLIPLSIELLEGDAKLWLSYPKKSSSKYSTDIDRDHGWSLLGEYGYEPVRQVAIDEDLSALRFRKVEFIKNFNRNKEMILSKEGRSRKDGLI
jgi:hypothetical protein